MTVSASVGAHEISQPAVAAARSFRLPAVPYRRLSFELTSFGPAQLSEYKGSMLRGAFGHALRRAVCAMGAEQPCAACALRRVCIHTRLFETFIEGEPPPFFRGLDIAPRPYVFEALDGRRMFEEGDSFTFDLLLFGRAMELEPYARLAVERMARHGLGKGLLPFAVTGVGSACGETNPAAGPGDDPPTPRLTLRFLTPTRLKVRAQLVAEPTPRQLVFQMLRRVLEIAAFHVEDAAVDWEFRPLLDHADSLRAECDLQWRDWRRYSNRQQTEMTLGGFVGTMALEGDLEPFMPLLRSAELLHFGKGATFGLGWMRVEAPPPQAMAEPTTSRASRPS